MAGDPEIRAKLIADIRAGGDRRELVLMKWEKYLRQDFRDDEDAAYAQMLVFSEMFFEAGGEEIMPQFRDRILVLASIDLQRRKFSEAMTAAAKTMPQGDT